MRGLYWRFFIARLKKFCAHDVNITVYIDLGCKTIISNSGIVRTCMATMMTGRIQLLLTLGIGTLVRVLAKEQRFIGISTGK